MESATTINIKAVQGKILEIMKYIDALCRANSIIYYIMGGTALGAVRHGGFIPWDDDLDIFMTPDNYERFKAAFEKASPDKYILQEWRTCPDYLEYAKVRMNGTTFIEHAYRSWKDIHQGIYVDIMILHKAPLSALRQRLIYLESKYVTLYGLSRRNWMPHNAAQAAALKILRCLPNSFLVKRAYHDIYRYDGRAENYKYCYWITTAKFRQGLFEAKMFESPEEISFEDTKLMCSRYIRDYLSFRYGDYMRLPGETDRRAAVHAEIYDTQKGYEAYVLQEKPENRRPEVLCVTMHQRDFSKIKTMNLQTDVIFANQADCTSYSEMGFQDRLAKMLTTDTRGVGKNRNLALLYASADICVLADDDMIFDDGYEKIIEEAFDELPQADIIIFNLDTRDRVVKTRRENETVKRLRFHNIFNYGAARIAFRLKSVQKANIWFSTLFGGGCRYNSGEDSLFLASALRNRLKIYAYPKRIATVAQSSSTWFCGYDEKYFRDKGSLYENLSHRMSHILCLQDLIRHHRMYKRGIAECYRLMKQGMVNFRKM